MPLVVIAQQYLRHRQAHQLRVAHPAAQARAGTTRARNGDDAVGQLYVECDQKSVQVGDHDGSQGQTCVDTPILDTLHFSVTDRPPAARRRMPLERRRIAGHRSRSLGPLGSDGAPANTPPGSAPAEALSAAAGKLAGMSAWQYAQLTIRLKGRGGEASSTILWHGPGQGLGENCSDDGQTVLELMNRVGADGWELAGLEERREGGDGRTYWDAAWSLTTYAFKRLVLP